MIEDPTANALAAAIGKMNRDYSPTAKALAAAIGKMNRDYSPTANALAAAIGKMNRDYSPTANALAAAIGKMNRDYSPTANALAAAIGKMNRDYSPAASALQAFENMDATLTRFRNLVAHLPTFDLEVRGLVSKLSEGDTDDADMPTLTAKSAIVPERPVEEGVLIRCTSFVWTSIVKKLKDDWKQAFQIPPRMWEEIVAGAFSDAGFEEVIITPRSGDHGRDVIAVRKGIGSVRILGSVKAYKPGLLITKEEVHALMGVVALDPNASKGIFATTSDFAPLLLEDPRLAAAVPHRIELMNGQRLQQWLRSLLEEK